MDCVEDQALIGVLHCTEVNAGKASNKGVGEVSIPNRGLDLLKHLQAVSLSQATTIADKGENVKNYFISYLPHLKLRLVGGREKEMVLAYSLSSVTLTVL